MVRMANQHPLPVTTLQQAQQRERANRQQAVALSLQSPATASLAVALMRDTHNDDGSEITTMMQSRLATYQRWQSRLAEVARHFRSVRSINGRSRALPMAQSA
jgi:hypothetical protein